MKKVSVYALSFDNRIKRLKQEIYSLYTLLIRKIDELAAVLQKNHIEFRWSGNPEGLPKKVVNKLNNLVEQQVSSPKGRIFNFAFNYGGRQEILEATKALTESGNTLDHINMEMFSTYLYHGDLGDIDLLVRTLSKYKSSL